MANLSRRPQAHVASEEKVESKEEWITATEAVRLLKPIFNSDYGAQMTICRRAHAGLIRARAERFMVGDRSTDERDVPGGFWWAEGGEALTQNWKTGDFETWIKHTTRLRAFGISFWRADIEKMILAAAPPAQPPNRRLDNSADETGPGEVKWDVFISHASEDKDDFARPLAESLRHSGLRVWFDEFTLRIGDGLRQSIDSGLAKSRYGIVVISPDFLQKNWPQRELDGLVARENDGAKIILPVWHNISVDEIRRYSPTLADRVAAQSSQGIEYVTSQLIHAIRDTPGPSRLAMGSPGSVGRSQSEPDTARPLRFVQDEQQSFWGPSKRGNEEGTQVVGHWFVTNTSDRSVVLLRVRLDGYPSVSSLVVTEGMRENQLYSSTYPIHAHRMARVTANFTFFPSIISGNGPLAADVLFTDNYEDEHRTRSTFHFVKA